MDLEEAYNRGYEDAFEGGLFPVANVDTEELRARYQLGWEHGLRDRAEVQRSGSSNT